MLDEAVRVISSSSVGEGNGESWNNKTKEIRLTIKTIVSKRMIMSPVKCRDARLCYSLPWIKLIQRLILLEFTRWVIEVHPFYLFLHKHWMSDFCYSIHVVEFRSFFTESFVKMTELQLAGDHWMQFCNLQLDWELKLWGLRRKTEIKKIVYLFLCSASLSLCSLVAWW